MSGLRAALSENDVKAASMKVMERFFRFLHVDDFHHFLAYLPINNEVDTRPLITELMSRQKKVFAPRCDPAREGCMDYYLIRDFSALKPGYCGIAEPCPDSSDLFINNGQALCILPGLAFDRQGYRLGYGLGFFDRYLNSLVGPKPFLTGFAYNFQVVESLPVDDWDMPVDMVINEYDCIRTRR